MAYLVVRTIKGRQYRYLQRSYRDGKKVKTASIYLGPIGAILRFPGRLSSAIGDLIEANRTTEPVVDEGAMLHDVQAKEVAHARMIERFEEDTGLKIGPRDPLPIEKPVPTVPTTTAPSSLAPSADARGHQGEQAEGTDAPTDVSS